MKSLSVLLLASGALAMAILVKAKQHEPVSSPQEEGLGRVHMDTSCPATVAADFDRALALLHNFWYVRALERFNQILKNDPGCAMAYWGAAMSYNPSVLGSSIARRRNCGVDS